MALLPHPLARIGIPIVTLAGKLAECALDIVPSALVFETTPNQLGHKRAAPPRPRPPVQLGHKLIIQRYVQTHVPRLAHTGDVDRPRRPPGPTYFTRVRPFGLGGDVSNRFRRIGRGWAGEEPVMKGEYSGRIASV